MKLRFSVLNYLPRRLCRSLDDRIFRTVVGKHWMKLGDLNQYAPRPIKWDTDYRHRFSNAGQLRLLLVTPSLNQGAFLEQTIASVVSQQYGKLFYVVRDGGSVDQSIDILKTYQSEGFLTFNSEQDGGQTEAINNGFSEKISEIGDDDIMAWINSDDLYAPNTFAVVSQFFQKHSEIDVVYGHRILIDAQDREIGRWVLPPHCPETIKWVDYIPQETLFWRKRAWVKVGGLDVSFKFAMDWDLILRFQQSGCKIVRIPHFLGAFRVHDQQKTSQVVNTLGAEEMAKIRMQFGDPSNHSSMVQRSNRKVLFDGAVISHLNQLGLRV